MFSGRIGTVRPLPLALAALFGACAPGPDLAAPMQMHVHYSQVGEIRSAVVVGDVDATRAPARWLAGHRGSEYPADASDVVEAMRAEGRFILAREDVAEIAGSVARMGASCGTCHRITQTGPRLRIGDAPPQSPTPGVHMSRHVWALDRLWDGLIGPSDRAWVAGASALSGGTLDFGKGPVAPEAERLEARVHQLGRSAHGTRDVEERVTLYGELLQTCARCHAVLEARSH